MQEHEKDSSIEEAVVASEQAAAEQLVKEDPGRVGEFTQEELALECVEAQKQAAQWRDQNLRLQAEMENIRRRAERDVSAAHKFGAEKLLKDIVPVLESLEQGLLNAGEHGNATALYEGMELTHKMLIETLRKHGVHQINPEGMPFNSAEMQAISMVPNANVDPNTVITVVQKGYKLNERLLKAAMVVVSRAE
jgi:molecular chaperone GrpE